MLKKIALLILVVLLLSACNGTRPVDTSVVTVEASKCVRPESDNEFTWSFTSCVDISTEAYVLVAKVYDDMVSRTETLSAASGVAYGGYATYSAYTWQEGKGNIPVTVISIKPDFHDIVPGDHIVIKTTDTKVMPLSAGMEITLVCREDIEVLSPVQNGQVLTTKDLTYELDNCRMVTPNFEPGR